MKWRRKTHLIIGPSCMIINIFTTQRNVTRNLKIYTPHLLNKWLENWVKKLLNRFFLNINHKRVKTKLKKMNAATAVITKEYICQFHFFVLFIAFIAIMLR